MSDVFKDQLEEFDPNEPTPQQKRPEWATFVPRRNPSWKQHYNRGHAISAAQLHQQFKLYHWNGEDWDEVARQELPHYEVRKRPCMVCYATPESQKNSWAFPERKVKLVGDPPVVKIVCAPCARNL